MKMWKISGWGTMTLLSFSSPLWAQIPAPPGAPAAAAAAGAPAGAAAAAPGCLTKFCEGLEACKEKFCRTPLGRLVGNSLKPVSALTGGLIQCCPEDVPSAADLAKPATSAEGAAAQIMKDEAEAKARRAAVRYLGSVDCHWWPEAEKGLIGALRADRNECVRLEAALALGRGCCCTKNTIEALRLTVSGGDADGNPTENSERVKAAAHFALERCLACYSEVQPAETPEAPKPELPRETPPAPEKPPQAGGKPASEVVTAYQKRLQSMTKAQVVEEARRTLARPGQGVQGAVATRPASPGVYNIIMDAVTTSTSQPKETQVKEPQVKETQLKEPQVKAPSPAKPMAVTQAKAKPVTPVLVAKAPKNAGPEGKPVVSDSSKIKQVSYQEPAPASPYPMVAPPKEPKPLVSSARPAPQPLVVTQAVARPLPVAPAPAAPTVNVEQMIGALRDSVYPEQREWAANVLSCVDWRAHPALVPALLKAARDDADATVRTACVRCLGRMNANTVTVVNTLQTMKADTDPRVRHEVDLALANLAEPASGLTPNAVRPASTAAPSSSR